MTKSSTRTAPSPSASTEVVQLSGPAGLVAAIPQCLGFVPTESLVLVCMTEPRHRVGPVARVDLFPAEVSEPIEHLVAHARRYADCAALVCYHEGDRPGCLDAVLASLADEGIPLFGAVSVSHGRIRASRSDTEFRDDAGVRLLADDDPQAAQLSAAAAFSGRRPLASRDELVRSIAAPVGRGGAKTRSAIEQIVASMPPNPRNRAEPPTAAMSELVDATLTDAWREYGDHADVGLTTAATLIALCTNIGCRDRILYHVIGHADADVVAILIAVARRCPDEHAAEICALLAMAAYRFGDGALAHCALDRTFAADEDHRLGHLLLTAMIGGLPPSALSAMAEGR